MAHGGREGVGQVCAGIPGISKLLPAVPDWCVQGVFVGQGANVVIAIVQVKYTPESKSMNLYKTCKRVSHFTIRGILYYMYCILTIRDIRYYMYCILTIRDILHYMHRILTYMYCTVPLQ